MAVAVSGAVIVDQTRGLKYRKKCEFCGFVEGGCTIRALPRKGTTIKEQFTCPKCKKKVPIIIQGT